MIFEISKKIKILLRKNFKEQKLKILIIFYYKACSTSVKIKAYLHIIKSFLA